MTETVRALISTVVHAVFTVGPQFAAMLILPVRPFAVFSLVYLSFALGASVQLSFTVEAEVRAIAQGAESARRKNILAVATWIGLLAGIVTAIVALIATKDPGFALISFAAASAGVFRSGARFIEIARRDWRSSTRSEIIGLTALILSLIAFKLSGQSFNAMTMTIAWAAANLSASFSGYRPTFTLFSTLIQWWRIRGKQASELLRDSAILDFSSIGVPYLLTPVLGLVNFGIYRAISNVGAPVRMIINPLRPVLAKKRPRSANIRKYLTLAMLSAICLGLGAWVCIYWIDSASMSLGVIAELGPYAIAAALFVGTSFIGHFAYVWCRSFSKASHLLTGRFIHSLSAIILPLVGALAWGLSGAIWSYIISVVIGAIAWVIILLRTADRPASPAPS